MKDKILVKAMPEKFLEKNWVTKMAVSRVILKRQTNRYYQKHEHAGGGKHEEALGGV